MVSIVKLGCRTGDRYQYKLESKEKEKSLLKIYCFWNFDFLFKCNGMWHSRIRPIISLSVSLMRNKVFCDFERCTINKSRPIISIFHFPFFFVCEFKPNDVTIFLLFRNVCPSQLAQYIEPLTDIHYNELLFILIHCHRLNSTLQLIAITHVFTEM